MTQTTKTHREDYAGNLYVEQSSFDANQFQANRQAEAELAAGIEAAKKFLGEDQAEKSAGLWRFQQLMNDLAAAHPLRRLFGWLDVALYVYALHTVPVLWVLDRLLRRQPLALDMLKTQLDRFRDRPWHESRAQVGTPTLVDRYPMAAAALGMLVFVISSPLVLWTVPQVLAGRMIRHRLHVLRWGY